MLSFVQFVTFSSKISIKIHFLLQTTKSTTSKNDGQTAQNVKPCKNTIL